MKFSLTKVSGNAKTGPIATSMTAKDSCPDTCQLKAKGCYATYGPTAIHWGKVSNGERGVDAEQFLREVAALPRGKMFRHNVAGDLPHANGNIDAVFALGLADAAKRLRGFAYTHHAHTEHNLSVIREMAARGFIVNLSTNTTAEAVEAVRYGIPVATILPMDAPNVQHIEGVKIVACPAEKSDKVTCETCGICAKERDYVVGFRAHGTGKKHVDVIARG